MANDSTSERLWILDSTEVVKAIGNEVIVRKLVYYPAAVDNSVTIQEYSPLGVLRTAMGIQANHTDVNLVSLDFGDMGRRLNGFKLSAITAGTLHVYIGRR